MLLQQTHVQPHYYLWIYCCCKYHCLVRPNFFATITTLVTVVKKVPLLTAIAVPCYAAVQNSSGPKRDDTEWRVGCVVKGEYMEKKESEKF